MSETGYAADHSVELTTDPDWDELEKLIFGVDSSDSRAASVSAATVELMRKMMEWVYGDFKSPDKRGIANRSIVLCWFVLPAIERLSLTELAAVHGCSKQNLGKCSTAFQKRFPEVRNSHIKK